MIVCGAKKKSGRRLKRHPQGISALRGVVFVFDTQERGRVAGGAARR
jgi:hypothetical protein